MVVGRRFANVSHIYMAELDPNRHTPLHPGVDAQSWLGFEQRIQARRFDALVASTRQAIAAGNAVLAQHAIEEARELRPNAPELADLQAELRVLAPPPAGALLWRRAAGALMLLIVGVSMFIALDQTRVMPSTLPMITPPPPQLLGAVPTLRTIPPVAMPIPGETPDLRVEPAEDLDATREGLEVEPAETRLAPSLRAADNKINALPPRAAPARSGRLESSPTSRESSLRSAGAATSDAAAASTTGIERESGAQPPVARRTPQSVGEAADRIELAGGVDPPARIESSGPPMRSAISSGVPSVTPSPAFVNVANVDRTAEDQSRVAEVLRRYARAYDNLDVGAARDVWPSVDQRALSRAFESLASQTVSFDDCDIDVQGTTANASCRGQASYVGKVGRGAPRTEPRTWRFELRRDGETWKIANAEARRTSG